MHWNYNLRLTSQENLIKALNDYFIIYESAQNSGLQITIYWIYPKNLITTWTGSTNAHTSFCKINLHMIFVSVVGKSENWAKSTSRLASKVTLAEITVDWSKEIIHCTVFYCYMLFGNLPPTYLLHMSLWQYTTRYTWNTIKWAFHIF